MMQKQLQINKKNICFSLPGWKLNEDTKIYGGLFKPENQSFFGVASSK